MVHEEALKVAKPILFNTEMVRAILDGRKTVTRRVAFPNKDLHEFVSSQYSNGWWYRGRVAKDFESILHCINLEKPCKCKVGDILYVRETWHEIGAVGEQEYIYRADDDMGTDRWYPSIHMPQEAARIFLRVTDVRVERLQDIDGYGVLAEGVDNGSSNPTMGKRWENMQRMAYAEIWNSTVKKSDLIKYGWDADPWVWVIEFERVEVTE